MNPSIVLCRLVAVLVAALLTPVAFAAEPLVTLRSCKFIPTDWADGDSFQIQTPDGSVQTIRLYGADCIEWHVNGDTDARRLREQRRYFGISDFGGSTQTSIDFAKDTGRKAAEETARILSRPFTVHTSHADARGDGKHKRIYAFVTTADGEDLAEHLVRAGLARAFGVYRETPTGKPDKEYREFLRDVELTAAKANAGVWAKTNWERLPTERQQQRKEDADLELAAGKNKHPAADLKLNPNAAARDELMKIPGIGEVTANRIIQGRPYKKLSDLLEVPGMSPKILEKLSAYFDLPDVGS